LETFTHFIFFLNLGGREFITVAKTLSSQYIILSTGGKREVGRNGEGKRT